jgi:hypothetical protein
MEPYNDQEYGTNEHSSQQEFNRQEFRMSRANWRMLLLIIALMAAITVGDIYVSGQREESRNLAAASQNLTASLAQVQNSSEPAAIGKPTAERLAGADDATICSNARARLASRAGRSRGQSSSQRYSLGSNPKPTL